MIFYHNTSIDKANVRAYANVYTQENYTPQKYFRSKVKLTKSNFQVDHVKKRDILVHIT